MRPLDLLHTHSELRLDGQALRQTLVFAFATGGGGDSFERILAKIEPAPSTHSPECYATDLFLDDFVGRCLSIAVAGSPRRFNRTALKRVLAAPPSERRDVELRRAVFAELEASPAARAACEEAWKRIDTLRTAFESSVLGKRAGAIARRVEILRLFRKLVHWLTSAFAQSPSALARLATFAAEVQGSPGFRNLEQLLDYEDHLATLDLRVRVGRDGQIRALDILRLAENASHPQHRGPWSRWWQRLRMLFRGYAVHERELIGRTVELVFDGVQQAMQSVIQGQLQLEFYLALASLGGHARERGLDVCLPELVDTAHPSHFEGLFNPFLLLDDTAPVPCDLVLAQSGLTILTGPNSGGKTRLMQALGLCQLLAQSGAPVPARAARLGWRRGMFVSLVHEMSADQREGRLGTELIRIRRLFEKIGFDNLVLLDELCSGTNPSEGEEIVQVVIALLHRLRPQAMVCTHFLQFASRLQEQPPTPDMGFLQVELDTEQRPLYTFMPGVASTSLAAQTAERLGVTREALEALIAQKQEEA
jgi:DNA mismatch repair protein MutS2